VRQQGAPPPADPGRGRARPALTKRLFALTWPSLPPML